MMQDVVTVVVGATFGGDACHRHGSGNSNHRILSTPNGACLIVLGGCDGEYRAAPL